jgi:hypothetical protein
VDGEEDLEDLAQADAGRVELDTDDLDMPGLATADLLVRRQRHVAVAITRLDLNDALDTFENGFCAPETTPTQRDRLRLRRGFHQPSSPEALTGFIRDDYPGEAPPGHGDKRHPGVATADIRKALGFFRANAWREMEKASHYPVTLRFQGIPRR